MAEKPGRRGRPRSLVQPPEAYERPALVYDDPGFDRFTCRLFVSVQRGA
jgi:hypothetical protein